MVVENIRRRFFFYFSKETGTSSVHVAASRGQYNQIEVKEMRLNDVLLIFFVQLLCIFGGDPAAVDAAGLSPEDHAR